MRREQEVLKDKRKMLGILKLDGLMLECFSELKDDEESVLVAVAQSGRALKYASERLLNNKKVVKSAVDNYGDALGYSNEALRSDFDIVLTAVKQDGLSIRFASEELRSNLKIVCTAVQQRDIAFGYCGVEIREKVQIYSRDLGSGKTLKEYLIHMLGEEEAMEEKKRLSSEIEVKVGDLRLVKARL